MVDYGYFIITPNPFHWRPGVPYSEKLPGHRGRTEFPRPVVNNEIADCYFIKIGDQSPNKTTGEFERVKSYRTSNPSFYWCDFKVTGHVAGNGVQGIGKVLTTILMDNAGKRKKEQCFRLAPHGQEWYYDFDNETDLQVLINELELAKPEGRSVAVFESVNKVEDELAKRFNTATSSEITKVK